jgi:acyl transferase domain-containing protein/acyl carrier protein/aryl carrier-like protein
VLEGGVGQGRQASGAQIEQLAGAASAEDALTGPVLLAPSWEALVPPRSAPWPPASITVLLVGGTQAQQHPWQEHYAHVRVLAMQGEPSVAAIAGSISALGPIDHVVWLAPMGGLGSITDEALIQGQDAGVIGLYRLIKALLSLGYGAQPLGLSVVTYQTHPIRRGERSDATHGSVHGLIGSVAKEYGQWQVRLVDVPLESEGAAPQLRLEEVLRLPADPQGNAWAYRAGEWYRQQLILCELKQSPLSRYRQGGVYVVIGGAGGIGEVFSEYLIRTYQAQMIWIGRRQLDTAIQAKIDRLSRLGVAPTYLCADATDRDALEQAYQTIKARHGRIHGLVHAAIVLLDKSVAQMDEARFKGSLAAKVDVSVRMAQVFAPERLDCVLFFSSLQSFSKAAGQSNYAAGCTFMDAFAQQLAQVWSCPVKVMNWGFWGSVGIVASEAYRSRMAQQGIGSIEPAEGMAALEQLLSSPVSQVVLLKNTEPQVLSTLSAENERLTCVDEQLPSLIERLSPRSERVLALESTQRAAAVEDLQRLQGRLLFSQLQSLGLFIEARSSIATWRQQSELPALYGRWLDESVRILAGQGYLRVEGESCTVSDPRRLDTAALWAEWDAHKSAWLADPSLHAQVSVVEATLRALPQILTGKRLATDILFPNSSLALVAGVYKHNAVSDYFNAVLADAVVEFIAARCKEEPGARVRILEIGAGTGGTSEGVLTRLKPYQAQMAQYCYTDLSKAFLLHAQEHYAVENPYLTTTIFDVERPLAAQSIPVGSYDLVIASNVLHATTHIRHTLRNAKAALKGNGLLLLNEMSGHSVFAHLTFGLLEGWWLYDDAALRIPGTPALSPETWQRVLEEEGWGSIRFPAHPAHGLGQQIIVAESDGMIRQPRAMARTPLERPSAAPARVRVSAAGGRDDAGHRSNLSGPLRERATAALKKLVGQTLKIAVQQLDEYEPLERYGIDSILVVSLSNGLREFFPDLSSTLFFEHRTIAALVEHFIHSSTAAVSRWVGLQDQEASLRRTEARQSGEGGQLSAVPVRPMGRRGRRASLNALPHVGSEAATAAPPRTLDIAIIGMSGRFPQAKDINEFWENLKAGKDCITEIPKTRWDHSQYFDPEKGKPGKSYSKWGGFIEGIGEFDPLFFRLSPLEAQRMDPQERLFLQGAYASIEDAGYTPASVCASKRVGVYVGVMNSTYARQANYWSIANRVSYLFDFQGPSMAVDTACSSSLTAIHLAVESIQSGACDAAIAGGVNLIIDPIQYVSLSAMTMLSSGNQCKSFGDQADGFVDGEGVGAIVLKPLHQATIDGDHIYGVIKGSMVNAGGKTHGYTVPNPVAQRELIQRALKKANIDPRTISYVEAHGTGTSLGDPIEIAGLTQAFSTQGVDKQYCAIGSVKSNIGHLESAAGMAGLTKVLLQMQHRTLVPSLHSEVLNPHIDFARTPFKVQRCVEEWKRPIVEIDDESKEYPRIAGISSFGAGGANAHVIVEEYCEAEGAGSRRMVATRSSPALIVLSAKNEERLKEQASQLLGHIGTRLEGESELVEMAYTLQVGREAMEHRLGLMVTSVDELREKLSAYVSGKTDIEDCYRGEVRRNKEVLSLFTADEDLQRAIEAWVAKGKYDKVLELWVKGLPFDWSKLYEDGSAYGQGRPRRISLPTYPFARERYWIEPGEGARWSGVAPRSAGEHAAVLHPLLQRNTSDLSGQRFSSRFVGSEFYLSDHVVSGSRVLPGVCYLEMARAAVEHSVGQGGGEGRRVVLRSVVWLRPLVVEEAREVHIGLHEREDGEIEFEVYTTDGAVEGEEVVHAQGGAVLTEGGSESAAADWRVDLSALRAGSDRLVDGVACYTAFAAMGLEYGASHRGLVGLRTGRDAEGGSYVLAQVKLPASVSETRDQYYLHPSVLDSALQASVGLSLEAADGADVAMRPALPFALERLEILERTPVDAWVYVRPSAGQATGNGSIQKLDVDICDETGLTCVRLRGFTARVLEGAVGQSRAAADGREAAMEEGLLLLSPHWSQKELPAGAVAATDGERWVLVDSTYKEHVAGLEAKHPSVKWEVLPDCVGGAVGERFVAASEAVFARVQSILGSKPKQSVLLQVLADAEPAEIPLALSGLLKSAGRENPRFQGQVIAINGGLDAAAFEQVVQGNASAAARGAADVRYVEGLREVRGFEELSHPTSAARSVPWKDGGIYLITGGAGGLGLIIAEEIARHATDAKVILTGRGSLSEAKRVQIEALQGHGSHVQYRGLDVTDEAAVQVCVSAIVAEHGCLSGIVHSAGVIRDNFIIKKSPEEFRSVLSPKVSGVVNLDRATQAIDLDFLILFSSLAGVSGNVGQSDYALANAFMDQYASYRNGLLSLGERRGRTLSVNWPLWRDGGMGVDEATREQMRRQGLDALKSQDGLDALYAAWQSGESQVAVVVGDRVRIREWMVSSSQHVSHHEVGTASNRRASAASAGIDTDTADLLTKVEQAVIHEIAQQLMVKVEDIDAGAEISEFGFDSLSLTTFGNTLSRTYGVEMTPAIFFEYPTVHSFATYLVNEHAQRVRETFAVRATSALKTASSATVGRTKTQTMAQTSEWPDRIQSTPKRQRSQVNRDRSAAQSREPEPVAIIGMDGSFPQANSIEEFWENLKAGKDCITEIPKERWSLQDFYEPDPKVAAQASRSYGKWGGFMGRRSNADSLLAKDVAQELDVNPEAAAFFTVIENLLQNAALTRNDLKVKYQGSVGIYVGAMADAVSGASLSGVSPAVLANAVSRFYNIHGPSVAIDTWCSSSLTALHFACEGMARGDCKIAVAAGFHFLKPNDYVLMSNHKMLGSHIGSRSFTSGDGMIPGEGVGAVLLKPLGRALADKDVVLAVIRSTSIAHCGTNASQDIQTRMFLDNLAKAGVDFSTISYIEAGAVGSLLGDALEVFALSRTFEKSVPPGWSCPVGSVKPSIGHAMGVSGMSQLVKVVLQIQHRQLVPTIGDSREGHFANKPFHLQRELVEWQAPRRDTGGKSQEVPRRAIINSFGGGGSYVNVILEDPPEQARGAADFREIGPGNYQKGHSIGSREVSR